MLAIAAILSSLAVSITLKWSIVSFLIVSAYAFSISTPLAAITQNRGLVPYVKGLAKIVYLGNRVGALTSWVAAVLFAYAVFVSL
jgi:hypothetical protein